MISTAKFTYSAILKKISLPILELLPFFHQICKILMLFVGHNFETRYPSNDSDQVWFPLV
jgi:hypothetical protein